MLKWLKSIPFGFGVGLGHGGAYVEAELGRFYFWTRYDFPQDPPVDDDDEEIDAD